MKILYFLDFPHAIGGACKTLLKQAHIMSQRRHEITIVIPNDTDGSHVCEYDVLCRTVYGLHAVAAKFSVATCMETIDILYSIECYEEVYELIEKNRPNLICSTQINVTVEMVARELQIPHLMNIYQEDKDAFRISWLNVYPHYHSTDSELFSKIWGGGLGIPSKCIRTAYKNNNVCVSEKRKKSSSLNILSIGDICERKNQLEIIKFILKCKNNGMKNFLTFLGYDSSSYGEKCKEFVKENKLEEEVIFKGFVLDVDEYLVKSDIMICASRVESYPGVIIESISKRVPVLSTPVAGVPELMKDGYNCFLTQGYQCDDIYNAFLKYMMYKREDKIQEIIDHAYKTYEDNHSYEVVGLELEKYYKWILENYVVQNKYIRVREVEAIFSDFLNNINLNNLSSFTRSKIWFLYHIAEIIKAKKVQKFAIWGAGFWGEFALEWIAFLGCEKQFMGFIDSKKRGEYLSYPILNNKDQSISNCDAIFVAVGDMDDRLEIMDYLEQLGKKRNRDYFMVLNDTLRV